MAEIELMKTVNPALARALKRLHYPFDVILTCMRWYESHAPSLRNREESYGERASERTHTFRFLSIAWLCALAPRAVPERNGGRRCSRQPAQACYPPSTADASASVVLRKFGSGSVVTWQFLTR